MEETSRNIDRLVTSGAGWGGRTDRWIIPALYECASKKLGGKPISLVAAQKMMEHIKEGDRVILIDQFAYHPNMPFGETDGPPGVASLARAVKFGLGALPVLVTGPKDINVTSQATRAAGMNVMEYSEAKEVKSAAAAAETFPIADAEESKKAVAKIMDKYAPTALISVETIGPNKKGIKHSGTGFDAGAKDKLPALEYLFYEANARGIFSLAFMDRGNEMGSGTIEEDVRRITPYADVCQCPCGGGSACSVKTDIIFPAFISNWGAYAVTAMLGCLLKKPEILQDDDTERRVIEASIMAGAVDGIAGRLIVGVDGCDLKAQQGLVNLLHTIVTNALRGA